MLKRIGIGNFKAFAETQHIPIRPLTLIYGANSSGKSSFIHGLIFASHAIDKGEIDIYRTDIGGDSVDLGGFRQYIYRRDYSRRMEWAAELDTSDFNGRLAELLASIKLIKLSLTIGISLDNEGKPLTGSKPLVHSYEILADGKSLLRMSKRQDDKLRLDRLDHEHPIFRNIFKAILESATTALSIQPSDFDGLEDAISDLIQEIWAEQSNLIPSGLVRHRKKASSGQSLLFPEQEDIALIPVSKGRRSEDLSSAIDLYFPRILNEIVSGIHKEIKTELDRLKYLGPLRSYPPRHLAFSQYQDVNWYAGGGYAWDVVRQNKQVRELVNIWLGDENRLHTKYRIEVRNLVAISDIQSDYQELIEDIEDRWLNPQNEKDEGMDPVGEIIHYIPNELKKISDNIPGIWDLILIDEHTGTHVSHRDIGIGVSQVLPVLVSAYASKNQIIAIEQPEIHLHPALQSDLGDVFIESAMGKNKNKFIIETHSEHLMLRILRRIRETTDKELPEGYPPISPDQVSVLYVQPSKTGAEIIHIPVTKDGEFGRPWPQGFFAERVKEL